ncbi:POK9 protein, partial [Oreotrochilus melanogaster]|nr:POK9 protein [Oreotrochilus melanogaster]
QIPTGIHGPVYHENSVVGALLIGRSSTGVAGLVVLPGVTDADYTGEIMISCFSLTPPPPPIIKAGTRIAQLVLLPKMNLGKNASVARGTQGFGCSGSTLVTSVQQMKTRPIMIVQLAAGSEVKTLSMMMDTGADVTIIN